MNENFLKEIPVDQTGCDWVNRIAKQWFLITAGDEKNANTMTANWGGIGYFWMKPAVFVFIRPERYTFTFVEKQEAFTLAFLPEKYREALKFCGAASGRDGDKFERSGLHKIILPSGCPAPREAELILECEKMYVQDMKKEGILDPAQYGKWYEKDGMHRMYIAAIRKIYAPGNAGDSL